MSWGGSWIRRKLTQLLRPTATSSEAAGARGLEPSGPPSAYSDSPISLPPRLIVARHRCAILVTITSVTILSLLKAHPAKAPTKGAYTKSPTYLNTSPGVGYVGSKVCAGCHKDIYSQYIKTDMGRSMSLAGEPAQLQLAPDSITIYNEKLNRYFQVFRKGDELYQSEYELDPSGNEIFRTTHKLEYAIGAGANGYSYIVRRGDYLFQAPLSYYSKAKRWDLSPGYEFDDYGFSRPIHAACIVCHSGRPRPVPGRHGLYRDPPFQELAIGCESCHGPGQLHVELRLKGIRPRGVDRTIVNPARLPGWLSDNICMYCHQGGDARILQPGRDYLDFRPGTPLNDTIAIFKVPPRLESGPESDHLEYYFSMTLSKCYRKSGGRLSCISCHNPHLQPSEAEAPSYFRKRCLSCHTEQSCALPQAERRSQAPPDNCIKCHLPKRDVGKIAHSALTNHRIIARQGRSYPEMAFEKTTPELPDLIHLNAVPGGANAQVPPITLLQAYGELMASHPSYRPRYLSLLERLAGTEPKSAILLSALGRKAFLERTPEGDAAAMKHLAEAIELGSTTPSDFQDLAELLARSGRISEAIEILKRGISVAPYTPTLYKSLALRYIESKMYSKALETMREELRLFPQDSFMRKLIRQAEGSMPAR